MAESVGADEQDLPCPFLKCSVAAYRASTNGNWIIHITHIITNDSPHVTCDQQNYNQQGPSNTSHVPSARMIGLLNKGKEYCEHAV